MENSSNWKPQFSAVAMSQIQENRCQSYKRGSNEQTIDQNRKVLTQNIYKLMSLTGNNSLSVTRQKNCTSKSLKVFCFQRYIYEYKPL